MILTGLLQHGGLADNVLGHKPRHSKVYRNFAAEYERLKIERVAAFEEYFAEVARGGCPEPRRLVRMAADELALLRSELSRRGGWAGLS